MQLHLSPSNPLGAKGAGEGGIVAVAATAANAVAAALAEFDVQPNELPLSPPRVWALIQNRTHTLFESRFLDSSIFLHPEETAPTNLRSAR